MIVIEEMAIYIDESRKRIQELGEGTRGIGVRYTKVKEYSFYFI